MNNDTIKNIFKMLFIMIVLSTLVSAGGLADISKPLEKFRDALLAIAVVIVTLAFMYVGFMMIFRGAQWTDVARIFVGAMLIAGATALATLLFP